MAQKRSEEGKHLGYTRNCRAAGITGEPGDSESGQGCRARREPDQSGPVSHAKAFGFNLGANRNPLVDFRQCLGII